MPKSKKIKIKNEKFRREVRLAPNYSKKGVHTLKKRNILTFRKSHYIYNVAFVSLTFSIIYTSASKLASVLFFFSHFIIYN